jgi:hypothetical protein
MGKPGRKEARRQARLERRDLESRRRERQQRARRIAVAAVALVAAAGAAWGLWRGLRPEPTASGPGAQAGPAAPRPAIVEFADQGRAHIAPGQPHPEYNSNPPTSGWHYATPARWGFYNDELPDEMLVHNLEHGGIWISYRDAGDAETVDALANLARSYRSKVIVTHRPRNDSRIAVAAWTRLMTLDRFDRDAIVDFINRFRNKGPEFVPD